MKKIAVTVGLVGMILGLAVDAQASVTFRFDPDDLIQLYPDSTGGADNKATQVNARRTHERWADSYYETFNNVSPYDQLQPNSYNTYMNWRDGLGAGEGISGFNIWLQDNPRARSWGETTVWNPDGQAPTGTAAGNWSVETIPNPWGTGWLVQWWTDDPASYINPSSDIGEFSFTGTAYWDNNQNGYDASDPPVQEGESARIWFGAVNWTEWDEAEQRWTYEWAVHFDDQDWGQRESNAAPWSAGLGDEEDYGSGYEGVLQLTAAVPEPTTLLIWSALAAFAALVCWRRKSAA